MRLAEDRRARVPFALVGVVLLVGAAALVAVPSREPRTDPAVDRAVREATATTTGVLRTAVADAARAAARDPVIDPAATPAGRALGNDTAFEDALRVRIYLAARERFATLRARAGGVTATPWLPPVDNASDLRAAIGRVSVARAGPNGTALRVRVENVTVRATRNGREVGRRRVDANLTVASPVLALHDRAERFQDRLDGGPLEPGLGRRLTAELYLLAWARGYAQYGGAPVANVLGTRHVELATNGGALAVQTATLGASDPAARRAKRWAAARVAAESLLGGGLDGRAGASRSGALLRAASGELRARTPAGPDRPAGATPEATVRVRVGSSADRALAGLLGERGFRNLTRSVYAAGLRLRARAERRRTERSGTSDPPGAWAYAGRATSVERTVSDGGAAVRLSVPEGRRVLERYTRTVTETRTTRYRWRRGGATTNTTATVTREYAVTLAVVARPAPDAPGPARPVLAAFDPDRPAGPNLADVTRNPPSVVDEADVDAYARRAVGGSPHANTTRVPGDPPADLREAVAPDLTRLHRQVRNLSVAASRGALGTFDTNPAARLAERLRERRTELVGAPARYPNLRSRTVYAARAAYLDRVIADLERRAAAARRERSAAADQLRAVGAGSLERLRRVMAARDDGSPAAPPARGGLGGPLGLSVDTAPSYLSVTSVGRERLDARGNGTVTPLATRNRNVFAVPSTGAADAVLGLFGGPATVGLGTAARTLRASRGVDLNATARTTRRQLRSAVRDRSRQVAAALRRELVDRGVDGGVVNAALRRWEGPAARALALSNGSAVAAVARASVSGPGERERLAAALRAGADRALDEARVPRRLVAGTTGAVRAYGRQVAAEHAGSALANATDRATAELRERAAGRLAAVPAGLPVLPAPAVGGWYATVNVWAVDVRGGYERVTLRSRRGVRDTVYSRDGATVRLDVDDDGDRERLGNASRVTFAVSTAVVVVVPPGGQGVGDTAGGADERSPGW